MAARRWSTGGRWQLWPMGDSIGCCSRALWATQKWHRDMKVTEPERPFMLSSPLAVAQSCVLILLKKKSCVLIAIHNTDEETRHTDTATITFPDSQPLLTVTDVEHILGWL